MRSPVSRHWPLLLLLAVCAVVYTRTLDAFGMFMWDEAEYASIARSVLRGEGFAISGAPNHYRSPVLPLAAAASMAAAGRADDVVLKRATVVFALFALAVVYYFTAAEYGSGTGVLAAGTLAVMPTFWTLTAHLLTEMPFLAFFAAALFALHRALYVDARFFVGAGACAALALLTRYTAVLLAPACGLVVLAYALGGRGRLARLRSVHVAVGAVLATALVLPWLLRQQLAFGDALAGFRYASGQLDDYLPGVVFPWHFYLSGLAQMVTLPGMFLALFGFCWSIAARDRFGLTCALVVTLLLVWFSLYRYKELRLVTAALPFLAVLIALGLVRAIPQSLPGRGPAIAAACATVAALGWSAASRDFGSVVTLGYPSFLEAMASLHRSSPPAARIVGTAGPQIAWYADRAVVGYPGRESLAAMIDGTDWFVVTNFERGQQSYVTELANAITLVDLAARTAVRFTDGRFETVLVKPVLMRALLRRKGRM